ncbi:MAG: hypothetical protein SGILL_004785 [Bacillariaceae sp.]
MDNDAFKDLVRKQANVGSSKEIARKAVEDEFRKKKKRKRGGGYGSSSSEDEDGGGGGGVKSSRKNKKGDNGEDDSDDDVNDKAIQEDLAARYRDRAKERREGGGADAPQEDKKKKTSEIYFLSVPHNKKGLDLSLVRKERSAVKPPSPKDQMGEIEVRKEMPSSEEALDMLSGYAKDSQDFKLSRGVDGYVRSFVEWERDTVYGRYDRTKFGTAGKTIQNAKLAFAIDGHPSDTARAWERPRQSTLADGDNTSTASVFSGGGTMLANDVVDHVSRVFDERQRMLSQMKQQQSNTVPSSSKKAQSPLPSMSNKKEVPAKYDDDDDDIFGGLDDYVPPVPKKC